MNKMPRFTDNFDDIDQLTYYCDHIFGFGSGKCIKCGGEKFKEKTFRGKTVRKLSEYTCSVVINGKPIIRWVKVNDWYKPGDWYDEGAQKGIVKEMVDVDDEYEYGDSVPIIVGFKDGYGEFWKREGNDYKKCVLTLKFDSTPVPKKKEDIKIEICENCGTIFRPDVKNYCYNCGWEIIK